MKKMFLWGIILSAALLLNGCSKPTDQKNYIDYDTEIKTDKSIYKEEIKEPKENDIPQVSDNSKTDSPKKDEDKKPEVKPTTNPSSTYTKKYGWGLKRNNTHTTPEVSQGTKDLLKKNNAMYVGDTSRKVIYLTFDEGYENGYTPKILDTLKENNVKAAFFVTGPYVKQHADLIQRMLDEGHIVGNHTINHPSLAEVTPEKLESEIIGLDRMVKEKWNLSMSFMRPPKGEYSERVLEQLNNLGHKTVFWSFAYDDYDINNQKGVDYAYQRIMDNLHNGAIYLLHAVSKDNANVLDKAIKDIKAQGYVFENLDTIK